MKQYRVADCACLVLCRQPIGYRTRFGRGVRDGAHGIDRMAQREEIPGSNM